MSTTATDALRLIDQHLQIWNMPDDKARKELMQQTYSEDIWIIDPGTELHGYKAVSGFVNDLQLNHPGFEFTVDRESEVHHDTGILYWLYGRPERPDEITGNDVFCFHGGKICLMHVYINGSTGQ